jgi:hypothetical protein
MAPAWLSVPSAAALSLLDGRRPREWEWLPLRTACPSGGRRVPCRRPRTTGFSVAAQRRLVAAAAAMEMNPGAGEKEADAPFIEEMRAAAMRLHSRDQARDGTKEAPLEPPVAKWQTTVEGYLRFLVDSKLVFQTLEAIVDRAAVPWCECSAVRCGAVLLFSSVRCVLADTPTFDTCFQMPSSGILVWRDRSRSAGIWNGSGIKVTQFRNHLLQELRTLPFW